VGTTAQQQTRFAVVTSSGTIGTLSVSEDGRSADTVYRVDDNGRGSKLTEHIELGPDGLPRRWDHSGQKLVWCSGERVLHRRKRPCEVDVAR
jgi:hypothetical protein